MHYASFTASMSCLGWLIVSRRTCPAYVAWPPRLVVQVMAPLAVLFRAAS